MIRHTLNIPIGELKSASEQLPVDINFETWVAYELIAKAAGTPVASIHRRDIGEVAQKLWTAGRLPTTRELDHLFVLTMMWGSGTTNGRGPRNTEKALESDRVPKALTGARQLILDNDIPAAYDLHQMLPGIGPAFFTKLLWVLGQTTSVAPTPLILDSLVWKSLGALKWSSITAADGSRRRGDRYLAYLNACADWAADSHTPEDVEFTLFSRARSAA